MTSDFWAWASDLASAAALKGIVKAVILGAIAGATLLLTHVATRGGAVVLDEAAGHTVQSPKLIVVAGLCGTCAVAFLVWGILDPGTLQVPGSDGWWLGLVAGFTLGFLALAILSTHRWSWDGERFTWHGAFRNRTLLWRDLASAGPTWEGQYAARDNRGRKIRWSSYTLEHEALARIARTYLARAVNAPAQAAA